MNSNYFDQQDFSTKLRASIKALVEVAAVEQGLPNVVEIHSEGNQLALIFWFGTAEDVNDLSKAVVTLNRESDTISIDLYDDEINGNKAERICEEKFKPKFFGTEIFKHPADNTALLLLSKLAQSLTNRISENTQVVH